MGESFIVTGKFGTRADHDLPAAREKAFSLTEALSLKARR
jgi:hypothetical protein